MSYDGSGREATHRFPSGLVVRTDYTSYGQLRQLSDNDTGAIYWAATAAGRLGQGDGRDLRQRPDRLVHSP